MQDTSSSSWLTCTDGIAKQWQDFLLLVGRMIIGWIFVFYGWGKLLDIAKYATTFPGRGLSPWMAYIAVPVEFFVGLALILGFATRYAVLVMLFFMIVASFKFACLLERSRRAAWQSIRSLLEKHHHHWRPGDAVRHRRRPIFVGSNAGA
jgi:hypothetical protein